MKKLLSIIMMVVLLLSISVPVFATESTGSITITNATINETYSIYKLFDATVDFDAEGDSAEAVSYRIKSDDQFFEDLFVFSP